ncbi:MAG TPA: hypothetical protein PK373_10555, partial [Sedimentisphaerales bacterium]|nr:hypothetical protein [Sedimentisphaerales bacterium]
IGTPDATMERLNATARILRAKYRFKGYIHLKVIPGASDAAIDEAVSLASAVSLNIETPGAKHLARLSTRKDYLRDIIRPIKRISELTAQGSRFSRVKQTTQFIVGPAGESDAEIVKYMWGLYDRLRMNRIYFSAYQQGVGEPTLSTQPPSQPEQAGTSEGSGDPLMREHRLYQVDFLIRKYGFTDADIPYDERGFLSLETDPKESWALRHPEFFPVHVNKASRWELLRVPGLGPTTVRRILELRRRQRLQGLEQIRRAGARLEKARPFLAF